MGGQLIVIILRSDGCWKSVGNVCGGGGKRGGMRRQLVNLVLRSDGCGAWSGQDEVRGHNVCGGVRVAARPPHPPAGWLWAEESGEGAECVGADLSPASPSPFLRM